MCRLGRKAKTMVDEAREFWLGAHDYTDDEASLHSWDHPAIHVIEYSAYEQVGKEALETNGRLLKENEQIRKERDALLEVCKKVEKRLNGDRNYFISWRDLFEAIIKAKGIK